MPALNNHPIAKATHIPAAVVNPGSSGGNISCIIASMHFFRPLLQTQELWMKYLSLYNG
ncbi:hypothetical protein [Brevibacillus halotolerans]|uniref:hypothetical protein n=1 Tax=Brevibacillus halotolerans TaxID=1507437 RepID=UPI001BB376F4|nr:hypothetical protein [Brevibacillus halotolerans]